MKVFESVGEEKWGKCQKSGGYKKNMAIDKILEGINTL